MIQHRFISAAILLIGISQLFAQEPVPVGAGSYASYAPLAESRSTEHDGCQAYQTDHRHLYIEDSLANRPMPTNDWWTYALVNRWTGNLWVYPAMVRAEDGVININYPDYWEPTGCEMKWNKTISISADNFRPQEAIVSDWGDFHISFVMKDDNGYVKTTLMNGCPLVWMEYTGIIPKYENLFPDDFAVFELKDNSTTYITIGLLNDKCTAELLKKYAFHIPQTTRIDYQYNQEQSTLTTTFRIRTLNADNADLHTMIAGFIPHHYRNTTTDFSFSDAEFQTPRGTLKLATGNDFAITYDVLTMLPYFPAPASNLDGYDLERMRSLIADYAQKGSFGADTYWGGKGLVQMAHYMTFAHEIGDKELFEKTKSRLKTALIDWFTYTPGEENFYFARYRRFGALVGFDTSYDSDTFNDHHFHYGYFVYSAALLCLLDEDFRDKYGQMARSIALDYANWVRNDLRFPLFRTFNPWLGHSFAGGLGGENGNGQESTSEAMQSWGAICMLGTALGDEKMTEAGIFGYTLESRGTAEYWFDRSRQNIQYDKYQHPYCCNLTSQGIGWWTWFSGDPVWMHSIQWLPISPLLTNYLAEDTAFARWDYTQMYNAKQIGDYEAETGGLGDESGLGNVCLSYLSLFDPDSAARVFDRAWNNNKALAKNPDTGGITYWLTHAHRTFGNRRYDIHSDNLLSAAYTKNGVTTYIVFNNEDSQKKVTFTMPDGTTKTYQAPAHKMSYFTDEEPHIASIRLDAPVISVNDMMMIYKSQLPVTIHFYDQYGAIFKPDSVFTHIISLSSVPDTIAVNYQGINDTLFYTFAPTLNTSEAKIYPQVNYVEYGEKITFELHAPDIYGTDRLLTTKEYEATQIGTEKIKVSFNDITVSHSFIVLPPYPNLALYKPAVATSEENGGTLAVNVTDGDKTTRWSSEHKDGESIVVDLQSVCYINRVVIHWETAYASEYSVDISTDSINWQTFSQTCMGGIVGTDIRANAKYIRLAGIQRATGYGISLYELEAYGVPLESGSASQVFGIHITSDTKFLNAGGKTTFSAEVYNQDGNRLRQNPDLTITTNNATIDGNTIYCPTPGKVTLRAESGGRTAEYTWIVLETEKIISAQISPKEITIPVGTSQTFTVEALNQFGITEQTDYITYQADRLGTFSVVGILESMSDTAVVHVVEFSNINLALNKPVTVSGEESGATKGFFANDGNFDTRWSSPFQDNEWIEIDLQNIYYLTNIKLFWETSYAKTYSIELSTDGKSYSTIYSTTDCNGGKDSISIDNQSGRYVRINCITRSSGYGSSLWEIEVYGSGILETSTPAIQQPTELDLTGSVAVYNMAGMLVGQGMLCAIHLPQGIYVIQQNNKYIKIRIK